MRKILLAGLFILFSISLVFAVPQLPHAFEGQIISKDNSLTSGKTLIAKLEDGAVTGQTTIEGNNFKITVISNAGYGGIIKFFMGDEEAEESFYFEAFKVTKTNLTFDTIPDETIGSCGDGICAIEECSFCAIDCPVSKCNNNNVCDVAIGEDYVTAPNDCTSCGDEACNNEETCSTCPGDCGTCPVTTTTSTSSGGGGGGSSSRRTTATILPVDDLNTTSSDSESVGLSISDLNEDQKNTGRVGITGLAIGDFAKTSTGILTGLLILIAIILGIFFTLNKNKKK